MPGIPADIRTEFPLLARRTYLNSCSYGALARSVKAAIEEYIETRLEYGARWDLWVAELERVRGLLGRLLACAADDIAITTSVTEAVNHLASALDYRRGRDQIVVTDFDFPTTSQIWLAQQPRGARIVRASADATGTAIPLAEFERLIDARTLLVSVPHVCYRNGVRLDLEPIVALARSRGALVLVDGYQALGTLPVDAPRLGADFLVGGCLKYLLGTAGVGFLYVRDSRRSPLQPTATGWFAQADIGAMDIYHHRPHPSARRFDAGTPNVCGLHAVRAGLALLLDLGLDAVHTRIQALTGQLLDACAARGWDVATPAARRAAMIAIRSNDAPALVARLGEARIVVSDRDGHVRVSPHFYNNEEDIGTLVDALQANHTLLMR